MSRRDEMRQEHAQYTLLNATSAPVLSAVALEGPEAADAFRRWRKLVPLDDAGPAATRVLPLLLDLVERERIDDPDLQRMRGVARHIWTRNTLNVRLLLAALDALAADGVKPMLLKGLALFARSPDLMRKRSSSDGDILVQPAALARASTLLREHGFKSNGHRWEDMFTPLIESDASGVALELPSLRSQLDLHWRPLPGLTDPQLTEDVFARSTAGDLQGRQVLVPSVTDQLFLSLARTEPWDTDECLTRLVEAQLLFSISADGVDWSLLASLLRRYGLEALGAAFLGDLQRYAGLALPETLLADLKSGITTDKRREWEIRRLSPDQRSERQRWEAWRADRTSGRAAGVVGLPSLTEIRLRRLGLNALTGAPLWAALRKRANAVVPTDIAFLEGFSSPEAEGRWSIGHWSAIAVPLTPEQRAGEPVRLDVGAFGLGARRLRIGATGGHESVSFVQAPADPRMRLELRVRSLPELGGGGLILLWHPDARTPFSLGDSRDRRELGLFFRRPWGLPGRRPPTGAAALYRALRQTYRHLPLPMAVRSHLSPALGLVQQRLTSHTVPPPQPRSAIRPGDVVISAFLTDQSGIARAGRLTRDSLKTWGTRLVEHDITADPLAEMVPDVTPGGVWVCHCNPPEAVPVLVEETARLWSSRYRIAVWAYELERLPANWPPMLAHFHEIWAPSQFVADAIRRSSGPNGPVIRVVPHPMPEPDRGRQLAEPHTPFVFLTMFDARSTAARKNPMGAIRAFQRAFGPDDRHVTLLVKASYSDHDDRALGELHDLIGGWPNISVTTTHLSDDETLQMIAAADCLVSLHRSEGFGLTIAEAMTVGTPTIITGWSAPAEFSGGAAIDIEYDLVPVSDATGRYSSGPDLVWADARLDHAAREMQALARDPARWQAQSAAGLSIARDRLCRPIPSENYRQFLLRR